jgi:membrane-associated phospholipid phosphatase
VPRGPRDAGALGGVALALLAATAAVPLCGAFDAWLDRALDAWRNCAGVALANRVSGLVMPVGVAFLAVAVARALWRGRPTLIEIASVLAALGVGLLLVGALKDVLDRPRPGAEFLLPGGGSFPSGHVGNTMVNGLAILTLWWGGARAGSRWRGWLIFAAAVAIVAAARVYERRHWPSDVIGATAIGGAYGLLAIRHPDPRWRATTTLLGLAVVVLAQAAVSHGIKVAFPAGTEASRGTLERLAFGTAYERGWLRGDWAIDNPDALRRSAWLKSDAGEVVLPPQDRRVDEVRLVARPRNDLTPAACPRLRVVLNGRVLGEPLLQLGWRAYTFPTRPADFRAGDNILALHVSGDEPAAPGVPARRAAFSELTLHATAP